MCGVIIKLWNKDARAVSVHVRHASVEVPCVNVTIGAVLGELHVVRVVPVVVCDDAVVRRTLVLRAFTVAIVFIVAILRRILLYWRFSVYTCGKLFDLLHPVLAHLRHSSDFFAQSGSASVCTCCHRDPRCPELSECKSHVLQYE